MTKPSVSVIIAFYNEEKYIRKCFSSLFNQTLKPLEIIAVDDGSTDKTLDVLSEFQISNSQFQILRQKHQGPGLARNLGAKRAKGEILVFVDADMYFDRRYLGKIVGPILKRKASATFTKEEYVANPENIWSQCWSINSYLPINLHIDPAMPDEANNFRAILKKVFLRTSGYKDVGYGEDVTVLGQLREIKAKVAKGAICYHFNPSNLGEVFISARWMGRGETLKKRFTTISTFLFLNSLRKGIWESLKYKKPQFLIFKLVFDLGVFLGIWERLVLKIHKK